MANVFYPNFPIPATGNVVQVVWKLTRAMKKAGWNTVACSNGTTKTAPAINSTDSWGSNADPSVDIYPTVFDTTKAPWIIMSGPQTLRIRLNANPTGTFLRGEKITQATSAAEGELLGYVWSVADGYGWAVVLPRTGTFDNYNTVTGASSSATFVPTGTIQTYNREIMFGKTTANDTVNGQIWYVCCDGYAEATSLFSYLATQSGCIATNPPGDGGTDNGFPTFGNAGAPTGGAIAIRGVGGATTATSWFGATTGYVGNAQICCVNAIPATGISADGSFYVAMDNSVVGSLAGLAYQRIEDGDPGDIDPYVFMHITSAPMTSFARSNNVGSGGSTAVFSATSMFYGTYPMAFGYTARGVTTSSSARDIAEAYTCATSATLGTGANVFSLINNSTTVKTWNHPSAASPPIIREKLLLYCPATFTNAFHHYKGKLRWMFATSVGSVLQTSDANTYLCVYTGAGSPALWLGPYDGSSTPT